MNPSDEEDRRLMAEALRLAQRGLGSVEPNPMVGAVIAKNGQLLGAGWHQVFGGPHAEVVALEAAGPQAAGATAYVTLEPCCHHGKTPPCSEALLAAGIRRVVVATLDPNPAMNGRAVESLKEAGVEVTLGVCEAKAKELIAPFRKRITTGRPWVHAKWAMSLDGKIAARDGSSQWISGEASRARVHQLRGRVDAVLVGSGTVLADDPKLTARPVGPRTAIRVVLDRRGRMPIGCHLASGSGEPNVVVFVGPQADPSHCQKLETQGVEVIRISTGQPDGGLDEALEELGRRNCTNVLCEGGAGVLGSLLDAGLVDEVHVFIAPKLIGGTTAPAPISGQGIASIAEALELQKVEVERLGDDVYVNGRVAGNAS